VVEVIGRKDRGPLGVVAAVDHVVKNVLNELRRLLRPELVENEEVDLQQRPEDLRLADGSLGVEAGLNLLNEILKVAEEHPPRLAAVDDLDERGHREVR